MEIKMKTIQLPNLNENADVTQPIVIGTKSYTFNFRWIDTFCVLDILLKDKYLVKGRAMTTGSDLIGRVKDDELITGSLFLINKYGHSIDPTQETFSTDYYLVWVE